RPKHEIIGALVAKHLEVRRGRRQRKQQRSLIRRHTKRPASRRDRRKIILVRTRQEHGEPKPRRHARRHLRRGDPRHLTPLLPKQPLDLETIRLRRSNEQYLHGFPPRQSATPPNSLSIFC